MNKYGALILGTLYFSLVHGSCTKNTAASTGQADEELVQKAREALSEHTIAFRPCETAEQVAHNFGVLTSTIEGVTISWSSDRVGTIEIVDGLAKVTTLSQNEKVTLTATLTKGNASATKEFNLNVIPKAPPDTREPQNVIFLGFAQDGSAEYEGGYWKNGDWVGYPLTSPDPLKTVNFNKISKSGDDLYVAGELLVPNNPYASTPGYWKNGVWTSLPKADSRAQISSVHEIVIAGSDVYAFGSNMGQVGVRYPDWLFGYWKNSTWITLPELKSIIAQPTSVVVSGSDVYVTGNLWSAAIGPIGSHTYSGGYSKNAEWQLLEKPSPETNSETISATLSGSDFYVAGELEGQAGYWKNGDWIPLVRPNTLASQTTDIVIADDNIYAIGNLLDTQGHVVQTGYWKNGTWAATEYAPALISGCDIYGIGNRTESEVTVPGYWKNDLWITIPPPDTSRSATITDIETAG